MLLIDTGFFNIQVLQRALSGFNIELVPYSSKDKIAVQARNYPESIQGYICNLGAHWFAIRRFAQHYFNLNSFQYVPLIMPIQALKQYLKMIEDNGYSVFIVSGKLPSSIADIQLETNPVSYMEYDRLIKDMPKYIMDGKPINDLKGFPTGEHMSASIPPDLIEKYRKNPHDPQIQEMINSFLPDGMVVKGFRDTETCSCPEHHPIGTRLIVDRGASVDRYNKNNKQDSSIPKPKFDSYNFDQSKTADSRPQKPQSPSQNLDTRTNKSDLSLSPFQQNPMFEHFDVNQSDELYGDTLTTTTVSTQLTIRGGVAVTPDGRTRQFLLLQQSTRLGNPLMSMSHTDMMRMLQATDDDDLAADNDNDVDYDEEKKFILQLTKDRRRLRAEGKSAEEISRYTEDFIFEDSLKKAIDASLKTSKPTEKQSLEQPKTNPPSVATEEIIPLPSSLLKDPEPVSPPPINDSPPVTESKPDPSASLTVEGKRFFFRNIFLNICCFV